MEWMCSETERSLAIVTPRLIDGRDDNIGMRRQLLECPLFPFLSSLIPSRSTPYTPFRLRPTAACAPLKRKGSGEDMNPRQSFLFEQMQYDTEHVCTMFLSKSCRFFQSIRTI